MRKMACNKKTCRLESPSGDVQSGRGGGYSGLNPLEFNYTIPMSKKGGVKAKRKPIKKKRRVQRGGRRRKSTKRRRQTGKGRRKQNKLVGKGKKRKRKSSVRKRFPKKKGCVGKTQTAF